MKELKSYLLLQSLGITPDDYPADACFTDNEHDIVGTYSKDRQAVCVLMADNPGLEMLSKEMIKNIAYTSTKLITDFGCDVHSTTMKDFKPFNTLTIEKLSNTEPASPTKEQDAETIINNSWKKFGGLGKEQERGYTPGPWFVSPNGTYVRANGVHGWNIATIEDQPPYTKANAELIASAPHLKSENERLYHLASSEMRKADKLEEQIKNIIWAFERQEGLSLVQQKAIEYAKAAINNTKI